ncbi:MAG: hypothetical protein WBA10_15705, partial [Elainellaceae cyanobacterium]
MHNGSGLVRSEGQKEDKQCGFKAPLGCPQAKNFFLLLIALLIDSGETQMLIVGTPNADVRVGTLNADTIYG